MKKVDLIKALQAMPEDVEVCVYDWRLNATIDEDSGVGVYSDFQVELIDVDDEYANEFPEEAEAFKKWVAIGFDSGEPEETKLFELTTKRKDDGVTLKKYLHATDNKEAMVVVGGLLENNKTLKFISLHEVDVL